PGSGHLQAVDCAGDILSYPQLVTLAYAISQELCAYASPQATNGNTNAKFVVAIVSENHPYALATILGAWLAGGVAAPLDAHAPDALLRGMLAGVHPSVVVLPETAEAAVRIVKEMNFPVHMYAPSNGIPQLLAKFSISEDMDALDVSAIDMKALPAAADDALYLYTSSASSVQQLKCVPLDHATFIQNAARELELWYARRKATDGSAVEGVDQLGRFRVLGWGPFSHIMALAHDLTVYVALPGGCYVFGVPPAGYPIPAAAISSENESKGGTEDSNDLGLTLLHTAHRARANIIACVPWLFSSIRAACDRVSPSERTKHMQTLRNFRQLMAGGALPDASLLAWASENGFKMEVSVGMTECGGGVLEADADDVVSTGGYPADACLVADATLALLDEDGAESDKYGELVIRSRHVSRGYHNIVSAAHSTSPSKDGVTTFRTGDIYSVSYPASSLSNHAFPDPTIATRTSNLKPGARLCWEGRRDDFIQLASGELLDPRGSECALAQSAYIECAALVGDTFGKGAAQYVCAILEVPSGSSHAAPDGSKEKKQPGFNPQEVLRALARVNGGTQPPLRVPASRVVVLSDGEQIPLNRKGEVWRKKLEELFGERVRALLKGEGSRFKEVEVAKIREKKEEGSMKISLDEVESSVSQIVAEVLGISQDLLDGNSGATFAELGMDSNMAIRIVAALNARFALSLSQSTAHDYVDVSQLTNAIFELLTEKNAPKSSIFKTGSKKFKNMESSDLDDVVIVGQAFRLPGNVNDAAAFWDAVIRRRTDVLTHMGSDERWDHASFYVPPGSTAPRDAGTINFTQMGHIEIAAYDAAFFGISPAEARTVTPAARAALEVSLDALENANVTLSALKGSDAAVFVAQGPEFGFADLLYEEKGFGAYDRYYGTGVADSAISGRLSYFLDIHGPSVTLNTACSGGLVALDNACSAIQHGGSEVAIVCAVNVHVWPGNFGFLSANQMSSLHGRCATFSKDADGYVPSEGAVALVVKSRRAALRDNDNIIGIVRATAVRHNGRSQGLVAPNSKAQAALTRGVLARAGINPGDVDFVENHGTGTILGDMMEIQALNEVFGGSHTEVAPLVLGAAKTVFGHTESAAGLVGVTKALLSLRHGIVPGLAHLDGTNLSPRIDPSITPLRISHEATTLHRKEGLPLRALSLSFGFAGTIAAVVLEEYQPSKSQKATLKPTIATHSRPVPHLFVVSAKTEKALLEYLRAYIIYCAQANEKELDDICYTACIGREHYRFRFACICTSLKELIGHIEGALAAATKKPIAAIVSKPRIAFAFPGQGSQWQGMGRALADHDERFCAYLMDYTQQASELLKVDLMPLLLEPMNGEGKDKTSAINETHISQACIFVFQCAMVRWLDSFGIRPSATLTHSLGEIAAAVVSKAMSFRVALEFVVVRANAMRPERTNGGLMAAIRAPAEPIIKRITALGLSASVTIAAFNADTQHVVSGDAEAIRKLVDDLAAKAIKGTVLSVNQGFHSHCIDASLGPMREYFERQEFSPGQPTLPYYSSVEGRALMNGEKLDAGYWVKQARQPVRFSNAARAMLSEGNYQAILDVGPQNVIAHLLKDASTRTPTSMLISSICDRPATNTLAPLMQSLATLFVLGVTPDFHEFYAGRRASVKKIAIPTYPWQKQRHYPTIIPSRMGSSKGSRKNDSYSKSWEIGKELGLLLEKDHTINGVPIIPAAALSMFVSLEARKARPASSCVDIRFLKPMLLETPGEDVLKLNLQGDSFTCIHLQGTVEKGVICSGTLRPASPASAISIGDDAIHPGLAMSKDDVYEKFKDNLVRFGPSFQCIQRIDFSADHATSLIEVLSSGNIQHDFARKIDAIFHMFGAIAPEGPPELNSGGAFLPSAVNGLTLLTDTLPERLVCRYHLPITVAPNSKKMTAAFEVRDESGVLLITCTDYVVSWIPSTMPITRGPKKDGLPLLRPTWSQKSLESSVYSFTPRPESDLIYIGSGRMQEAFEIQAKASSLNLLVVNDFNAFFGTGACELCSRSSSAKSTQHSRWCAKREGSYFIVFDAMPLDDILVSESTMISSATTALNFVKAVTPHLVSPRISSVVVLTQNTLQIRPYEKDNSRALFQSTALSPVCLLGSFVHGMVRVVRQESSSRLVSALDFPSGILPSDVCNAVLHELESSNGGNSPIAYRLTEERKVVRLESRLVDDGYWTPAPKVAPSSRNRKCAVIVGMGDIGIELGEQLMLKGWSAVVFIGQKSRSDIEVASTLINLEADGVELRYVQADIASFVSVRDALETINTELGPIHSIVCTTDVAKNSTIAETTVEQLVSVIKPKALGPWNLHVACEELEINVERFVMLSTVSVSLGEPGQLPYVSAYSFVDELAGYRSSIISSKTARTYSIQLGSWNASDSEINHRKGIHEISNAQGIPLILSALENDLDLPTVSVLAKIRFSLLHGNGIYSSDPYFKTVINSNVSDVIFSKKPVTLAAPTTHPAQISTAAVEKFIAESLQNILGMTPTDFESLDSSTPVLSLGIDSISFTQLRADVSSKYEVDLPTSFLGEDSLTLGELAEYTADKAKEQRGSDKNSSTDTLVTDIDLSAKDTEKFISESLQAVLGMTSESLDSSMPVLSLGIDSISFTQLRADVFKKYEVDIPMSFLGEETLTLSELAEYTVEKAREVKNN
ncbi:hypothetical protein EW145_g3760, partial [Phellinidium pouzarii]